MRKKVILAGVGLLTLLLAGTGIHYWWQRRQTIVFSIRNCLDEDVNFQLVGEDGFSHKVTIEANERWFWKVKRGCWSGKLFIDLPALDERPAHRRLLIEDAQLYRYLRGEFVDYGSGIMDLRLRRGE